MVENLASYLYGLPSLDMAIPYVLLGVGSLGVGLTAMVLANLILKHATKSSNVLFNKIKQSAHHMRSRPPQSLQEALGISKQGKWREFREKVTDKTSWLLPKKLFTNSAYLSLTTILSFSIARFCLVTLKNTPAALVSVIAIILLMSQVFSAVIYQKRSKYTEQIPSAIRVISTVLEDTNDFTRALENVVERSPEPTRSLFRRVLERLNHGEQRKKVFGLIPKAMGTGHSIMLANVLEEGYRHGVAALPMFNTLASQFDTMHKLELNNKVLLIPSRFSSVLLHIGVVALVLLSTRLVPDAMKYITDNIGKSLVVLCFVSMIINIVTDKLWSTVEG
ncbi:hypothetical protein Dred_0826 [Desulforamulus reducens MI-1]|uniref:Type II secretion system protein GspF domain-containing protein n=1 Tax=Desulforamulus reducens (strain ATCC BAA-1160 / DSM 100696 / MI-1) TaxID=349161 RepID=A4J2R1_DESRM|nr:hypothetical protein [Desulforamulus reducens]ABO49364.1 hypothetical protein Dred_0826 [Desulforamulus reducens MI-1]